MTQKTTFETKCSECGSPVTVPFRPIAGKPVYCRPCYNKRRTTSTNVNTTKTFNMKNAWAMCSNNSTSQRKQKQSVFKQ